METRKICLSSWAWPWLFVPYGAQLRGLFRKLSKEVHIELYYLNLGNELPTGQQTLDSVYERYGKDNMGEHAVIKELENVRFVGGFKPNKDGLAQCDNINALMRSYKIDAYVYLGDLPRLVCNEPLNACTSFIWFPMHNFPLPAVERTKLSVFNDVIALAPSAYSELSDVLEDHCVHYIPHFIDPPVPPSQTREELREKYGIPNDAYVVYMHSGNYEKYNRKALDTSLFAFEEFYSKHPNAYLLLHAWTMQSLKGNEHLSYHGFTDVKGVLEHITVPSDRIYHNDKIVTHVELEEFYKMADVLLHGSKVEGFGLPVLEAQRRGIPVVTNSAGAMVDYTYYGRCVPPVQREYFAGMGTVWHTPSIAGMASALSELYAQRDKVDPQAQLAIDKISTEMSEECVAEQFVTLFRSAKWNPRSISRPLFRRFHYDEPSNTFIVYNNNSVVEEKRLSRLTESNLECQWALFIDNSKTIGSINVSNLYSAVDVILFREQLDDGTTTLSKEELDNGTFDVGNITFMCRTSVCERFLSEESDSIDAKYLRSYLVRRVIAVSSGRMAIDAECVING